tara:strand:+ start:195 stop:356 length:162 start_codon:yes stop_codon:yes gene_type:complete
MDEEELAVAVVWAIDDIDELRNMFASLLAEAYQDDQEFYKRDLRMQKEKDNDE